jgi:hypothetical protein
MASAQWLLNQAHVNSGAYWNAESGSSYKLRNIFGATVNRVTSSPTPYEGAGCYRPPNDTANLYEITDSSNNSLTGNTYYFDSYVYTRSSPTDAMLLLITGNNTDFEYSWVLIKNDGTLEIKTYDTVNENLVRTASSSGACPDNEWFRVQVKATAAGITETKLFKGTNINGTTADTTLTFTAAYSSFDILYGGSSNGETAGAAVDDIKFDNAAYPTRGGTAHTAAGTATATATGTAAMSNARTLQATATGTATGTAAASNQRTLAASASATATGTAAMSSTQAMSASGSVTASGTAAADVTSVVTVDASATVTASGTASMSSTQAMSASATITATGLADASIRPLVTVDGAGTITATGTTTFNKSQTLAASASATASATASLIAVTTIAATASVTATATATLLITTPGSLYGNAAKVAGLYGSSTKPTLTTRS